MSKRKEPVFSLNLFSSLFDTSHVTVTKRLKGKGISLEKDPESGFYVIPLSLAKEIVKRRKELELPVKQGMTFVFGNSKGGVGKTTISFAAAQVLGSFGFKVLVVDTDYQSYTISKLLIPKKETWDVGLRELLELDNFPLEGIIRKSRYPNIFVIPANEKLKELVEAMDLTLLIAKLKKVIDESVKTFDLDFVIIDLPPTVSSIIKAAIHTATAVVGVTLPHYTSFDQIAPLQRTVEETNLFKLSFGLSEATLFPGIIVNKYEKRHSIDNAMVEVAKKIFGDLIISPFVPSYTSFKEMITVPHMTIEDFFPASTCFYEIILKIFQRIKKKGGENGKKQKGKA